LRLAPDLDGELDHLLFFEFESGDVVEDVGGEEFFLWVVLGCGGGGEFEDAGGGEALEGSEGEGGAGVMGFVHDDDGASEADEVCEGGGGEIGCGLGGEERAFGVREAGEVGHERAVGFVEFSTFGIGDAECRECGDDDDGIGVNGGSWEVEGFGSGEDGDFSAAGGVEGLAVGVFAVFEGGGGLVNDGVGGGEPEDEGAVLFEEALGDEWDGIGGEDGFSAAGGDAEADVGEIIEAGDGEILAVGEVEEGLSWGVGFDEELEEVVEFFEAFLLVEFELEGHESP
jgi:hypothetical protein